jgi:hypothetical protein
MGTGSIARDSASRGISDSLEASNFAVASQELLELQMYVPDADEVDGERQSVQVVSENHWAVGWVELDSD